MSRPPPEPVTRTPTAPVARPVFVQEWTRLTYLHWRYDPAVVAPFMPPGVEPDLCEGSTWVGLIPFHLRRVRVLGTPAVPYVSSFRETNVRLYGVDARGRRGVVFRSLDADRLLPVLAARLTHRLPYCWSRMRLRRDGDELTYRSRRRWPAPRGAGAQIRVRIGGPVDPTPLDDFLTARWGLHVRWYGRTGYLPVDHVAWPLQAAELLELDETLITSAGLPAPVGPPRVLYSAGLRVRVGRLRVLRS
jgi:uncharacterized protein YqjF (DUF2071 family)